MEVLNQDTLCAITGLPNSIRTQHPYTQSRLNSIADLAETQKAVQELSLRGTAAERYFLTELGYDISHLPPLPPSTPS